MLSAPRARLHADQLIDIAELVPNKELRIRLHHMTLRAEVTARRDAGKHTPVPIGEVCNADHGSLKPFRARARMAEQATIRALVDVIAVNGMRNGGWLLRERALTSQLR